MDKITVENVNQPGQTTQVNAEKYHAMREAMLNVLDEQPGSLDYAAIKDGRETGAATTSLSWRCHGRMVDQMCTTRPRGQGAAGTHQGQALAILSDPG